MSSFPWIGSVILCLMNGLNSSLPIIQVLTRKVLHEGYNHLEVIFALRIKVGREH